MEEYLIKKVIVKETRIALLEEKIDNHLCDLISARIDLLEQYRDNGGINTDEARELIEKIKAGKEYLETGNETAFMRAI